MSNKELGYEQVIRSQASKWIAVLYWVTLAFLIILMFGIPLVAPMSNFERSLFLMLFFLIILVIFYLIYKANNLRFIILEEQLIIEGFMKRHSVNFSSIAELKKVPIPFGFRLFGASFLGGRYYFPGIGHTLVVMSNFDDGVLIAVSYTHLTLPTN